jgi:preprotein translocase subunit SecB
MTETYQKHTTLLSLTIPVASKVQIKSIRLLNAAMRYNPTEFIEGMTVEFGFDSEVSTNESEKSIKIRTKFETFAHRKEETDVNKFPVKIRGEYEIEYSLESFEGIKPENIQAFGSMNGVYNAWPYWREFVQSMTVRMALPPLTLPIMTGAFLENYYKEQQQKESESQEVVSGSSSTNSPPISTGQSTD